MPVGLIVAIAENGVIGKDNGIPWSYRGDLRWFNETTKNTAVIMGRKTWESLSQRPLLHRFNIVVTKDDRSKFEGAVVTRSMRQALATCVAKGYKDIWLIGGAGIYKEGLAFADVLFITKVPDVIEPGTGIVYFPEIDDTRWARQGVKQHPYARGLVIEAWGLLPTKETRKAAALAGQHKAVLRRRRRRRGGVGTGKGKGKGKQ